MRRLLLLFVLVPTFSWVFWASCQSDDYRDTLPFRVFDATPREAGPPPDLTVVAGMGDLGPGPRDQGPADLPPADGGTGDAGSGDGGSSSSSDGGSDAGAGDAGTADGGGIDGGSGD